MYVGHEIKTGPIEMSRFDVTSAARVANQHLKAISEPRRRQILINFRDHALAEALGDHEALMATCSEKRQRYVIHGSELDLDHMQPQSYEELFPYYKALIDLNIYLIHTEMEKLIVGDDCLMLDAVVHQLLSGEQARDFFGVQGVDPEAVYQAWSRAAIMFTFDEDGMGSGEHSYSDGGIGMDRMQVVAAEQVPPQYFNGPRKVADFFRENPSLDWPGE